jgi:hypothetical protein
MIRGVAATVVVEVRGALDPAAVRYSLLRIIRVEGSRGPPSMHFRCSPKADVNSRLGFRRLVPLAAVSNRSMTAPPYSITSSASESRLSEILIPSAFAV